MQAKHGLIAAVAAVCCLGAGAQTLKPGLWEVKQKMQSSSGEMEKAMAQMQQQMASLPPEQRKMMQDMLAKQGVGMGSAAGEGMSAKLCLTREMIERNELPTQQHGDCKTTTAPRQGNNMKMSFTCANPPSSGEGQWTFHGPEAFTSRMLVNTTVQGRPEKMNMEGTGRWLSADCGAVKPLATPGR